MILVICVFAPMIAAVAAYIIGRSSKKTRDIAVCGTASAVFVLTLYAWMRPASAVISGFCGLGITLRSDGFRGLYACIAAFMWMISCLFSPEYFAHYRNRNRYYLFNLMTLGATLGVFYSDDLYTTLIFFEIMSIASFTWVAQEETDGALRAACTYLAVAVIGGLATLMGLFMLYNELGTLAFDGMREAVKALPEDRKGILTAASWLTLTGFAAKAGMFPLHIWLPKAHPVAPAPASSLLSGILTKSGIFGLLVIATRIMYGSQSFANILLIFAVITMFIGALLALLSIDLKRTLACSSMSQIGFITVGISMMMLLGEEGSLAAYGTVLHMVNHSLIKLCLFLCAGTVYMNLHKLDLNEIRGFGRNKPFLKLCFLSGALSIACVPPFGSGYNSKSLLHEGILEWLNETQAFRGAYKFTEILFLISGGLTVAYMTKLFVCIFIEKNTAKKQAEFDGKKNYIKPVSMAALACVSVLLPLMGLFGNVFMTPLASGSMEFLKLEALAHKISYFSGENLKGAAISVSIGAGVYLLVVRTLLMKNGGCVNVLPKKLDLEDLVYRPLLLKWLPGITGAVTAFIAGIPDSKLVRVYIPRVVCALTGWVSRIPESRFCFSFIPAAVTAVSRCIAELPERMILFFKNTLFKRSVCRGRPPVGNRFTWGMGMFFDRCAALLNRTVLRKKPMRTDFEYIFDEANRAITESCARLGNTVSFGLLLLAAGLLVTCIYLLIQ